VSDDPQVLDCHRGLGSVQHGMTIRTYRSEIIDRINYVFLADAGKRNNVMDMNVVAAQNAKRLFKIEPANKTPSAMVSNAVRSRRPIPLVRIDNDVARRSLDQLGTGVNFVRITDVGRGVN
jgi:hypothetical protein